MANKFHRFRAPVFGPTTFPSTDNGVAYDYINVSAEGNGGAAAMADVAKVGGPNAGTYFYAFGEDAVSQAFNRGFRALADNTDTLDDRTRRPIVRPTLLTFVVPSSTNVLTIPAGIYLGRVNQTLNQAELYRNFRVLDANQDEKMDQTSLEPVQVIAIAGFSSAPASEPFTVANTQITLSHTIGAGTYYLYCGQRSSVQLADEEFVIGPFVGAAQRVSAAVIKKLTDIYGQSSNPDQPWYDDPNITLYGLKNRGLNNVVNNSLGQDPNAFYDSGYPTFGDDGWFASGAGGLVRRSGFALQAYSDAVIGTPAGNGSRGESTNALWMATVAETGIGNGSAYNPVGISRGFVAIGNNRRKLLSGEGRAPSMGLFTALSTLESALGSPTFDRTRVLMGQTVSMYRFSGQDRIMLTESGNFFRNTLGGITKSAIVLGVTMLEVESTDAGEPLESSGAPVIPRRRLYVVTGFAGDQIAIVRMVGGSPGSANLPVSGRNGVLKRILTPTVQVLDGGEELRDYVGASADAGESKGPFVVYDLPKLVESGYHVPHGQGAYYGASSNTSADVALAWGGFEENLNASFGCRYARLASLRGDGSIVCPSITTVTCSVSRLVVNTTVANTQQLTATEGIGAVLSLALMKTGDIATQYDSIHYVAHANGSLVASVTMPTLTAEDRGRTIELIVSGVTGAMVASASISWPSQMKFTDPADRVFSGAVGKFDHYTGRVVQYGSNTIVLMSLKRYEI